MKRATTRLLEGAVVEVVADATVRCQTRRLIPDSGGLPSEHEPADATEPTATEQDRARRRRRTGDAVHGLVPWESTFGHRATQVKGPVPARIGLEVGVG